MLDETLRAAGNGLCSVREQESTEASLCLWDQKISKEKNEKDLYIAFSPLDFFLFLRARRSREKSLYASVIMRSNGAYVTARFISPWFCRRKPT